MKTKIRDTASHSNPTFISSERPKKILIIQSASRVFNKALSSLKEEFPNASFTTLTANPDGVKKDLSGNAVHQILKLPKGKRISIFSYGFEKRKQLRQQNFDIAVVLYNIEKGWGYANVESLAWSTGAGEQRGYFPNGSFKHLTFGNLLKNSIREQTALGWVALNIITAVFQLIIFGSAMAGEALYRRVNSKTPFKPRTDGSQ